MLRNARLRHSRARGLSSSCSISWRALLEQAQHFAEAAAAAQMRVDGRMLVDILAVEPRGRVELANGVLGIIGGDGHIAIDVRLIGNAHQQGRAPQVAAGVEIGGVPELRGRVWGQGERGQDRSLLEIFSSSYLKEHRRPRVVSIKSYS